MKIVSKTMLLYTIVLKHPIYTMARVPPPFFSSPSPFKHQIQESAVAKAYDAEWKWMNSSEAKQRGAAAKALALSDFQKRFPHAQRWGLSCSAVAAAHTITSAPANPSNRFLGQQRAKNRGSL